MGQPLYKGHSGWSQFIWRFHCSLEINSNHVTWFYSKVGVAQEWAPPSPIENCSHTYVIYKLCKCQLQGVRRSSWHCWLLWRPPVAILPGRLKSGMLSPSRWNCQYVNMHMLNGCGWIKGLYHFPAGMLDGCKSFTENLAEIEARINEIIEDRTTARRTEVS